MFIFLVNGDNMRVMSYIEKTLMADEKILYSTHPHWIVFYAPILWLLVCIFVPIINSFSAEANLVIFGNTLGGWIVRFAFLMMAFSAISSLIKYLATEYVMTNRRMIVKTGLIRRNSFEIFLNRIESIQVDQSVFGRIMDYGTIVIGGVGGSKDTFFYIPSPLALRQKVQEHLGQSSNRADGK